MNKEGLPGNVSIAMTSYPVDEYYVINYDLIITTLFIHTYTAHIISLNRKAHEGETQEEEKEESFIGGWSSNTGDC